MPDAAKETVTDKDVFERYLLSVEEASSRARKVFITLTIASLAQIAAAYNAYLSWLRGFVLEPGSIAPTPTPGGQVDTAASITRFVQEALLRSWVESTFVSVPLIGVRLSIADAGVLGGLTLAIISLWFFYCMRRENHLIARVLCDVHDRCAALNKLVTDDLLSQMVVHGIRASQLFASATRDNAPLSNVTAAKDKARRERIARAEQSRVAHELDLAAKVNAHKNRNRDSRTPAISSNGGSNASDFAKRKLKCGPGKTNDGTVGFRALQQAVRLLMYLPAMAILMVLVLDILTIKTIVPVFRWPHRLVALPFNWWAGLLLVVGVGCFLASLVWGNGASKFQQATQALLIEASGWLESRPLPTDPAAGLSEAGLGSPPLPTNTVAGLSETGTGSPPSQTAPVAGSTEAGLGSPSSPPAAVDESSETG